MKKLKNKLPKFRSGAWAAHRSLRMRPYSLSHPLRHLSTALHWQWMAVSSKPPYDATVLHFSPDHLVGRLYTSTDQHPRTDFPAVNCRRSTASVDPLLFIIEHKEIR